MATPTLLRRLTIRPPPPPRRAIRRTLTLTSTTAPASRTRRIISRTSLNSHLPHHPTLLKPPPPPPKIKDASDTPWPTPLRIAGYGAMVLSVPYCIGQSINVSPRVRGWLEGDRPDLDDDRRLGKALVRLVRTYWGSEEGIPYVDLVRREEALASSLGAEHDGGEGRLGTAREDRLAADDEMPAVLELEPPSRVRAQQVEVERSKHAELRVRPSIVTDDDTTTFGSDDEGGGAVLRVDGTVRAVRDEVGKALTAAGWKEAGSNIFAVEFDDDDREGAPALTDGIATDEQMERFETSGAVVGDGIGEDDKEERRGEEVRAAQELKRLTYTWSAWHHDPTWSPLSTSMSSAASSAANTSGSASSTPPAAQFDTSADGLRAAMLEETIQKLRSDLRDPNCTRDMDDMERELREAREELWGLRGGWGGKIRKVLPF